MCVLAQGLSMNLVVKAGYSAGCIGRVAELHARFYSRLVNFGLPFEAKVAREMADFLEQFQEGRDGIWLAMHGDEIHGSVVIDGSHASEQGAHLRWFITSNEVRGTGIGSQLLSCAMAHCAAQRFQSVYLWTFEGLAAARHLYEKHGFQLVHQQSGSQWGQVVNEQRFERTIKPKSKSGRPST
jgi:GNAT superfamily N-acetyltransferase